MSHRQIEHQDLGVAVGLDGEVILAGDGSTVTLVQRDVVHVHRAAREPEPGAVRVFQDASVYVARLGAGQRVEHALEPGRTAWVQVARGAVHLDDVALREGDGAAVTGQDRVAIQGDGDAEVLVFDLSMRH